MGYSIPSLVRFDPMKRAILKFFVFEKRKFPYEKLTFFLDKLYKKFLLFWTLGRQGILHAEFGLISTTPSPDEKDLFLKFFIREIRKFPYEKLTFFF